MNNKRVHWSQYADEISFLTIRDIVRLSDSVDDDYFSDEEIQVEEPKVLESEAKEKKKGKKKYDVEFWPVEEYLRRSTPQILASEKSFCNPVYDAESSASDDSNFYEDINYLEVESDKKKQPKALRSEKTQEQNSRKKEKMKKKGEEPDYKSGTTLDANASNMNFRPSKRDERSALPPRGLDSSTDCQSLPSKTQDNCWISPQISLSKWNSNSARGDYSKGRKHSSENRKLEKRSSRASSSERRRNRNIDGCSCDISKSRITSESRRVSNHLVKAISSRGIDPP